MPSENKPNWGRIKADYLKGGTSYAKIATKYGINQSTLEKRAKREGWAEELRQICGEVAVEIHQQIVQSKVMDASEVLERVSNFSRGGMGRVASWGPGGLILTPSDELEPEDLELVLEVSETRTDKGGSLKIKLADPLSALDKMMKHYGLYKSEGGGNGGGSGNPTEPGPDLGTVDFASMDPSELAQLYREACKAPGEVQD